MIADRKEMTAEQRLKTSQAVDELLDYIATDRVEEFIQLCYDQGLLWCCQRCGDFVKLNEQKCECDKEAWN